jgi:GMP synthase-like glutamine amidotransferase
MRVLAVTHGPSVGAGVFAEVIRAAGHDLEEWCVPVAPSQPSNRHDATIVLGGGMHADQEELHPWLLPELDFIAGTLDRGAPLLGVCLGAQLIARAAGGRVIRAPAPEVGWREVTLTAAAGADPVLSPLPERFDAFQWHHYTWELPAATELARGGGLSQAYRLGERAWSVQFHPEVTAAQIARWIAEDPADVADEAALRSATRERIGPWNRLGRELCATFLRAANDRS